MRCLGALFLVFCLVLMVAGCSGGVKPDPEPGQQPGESGKDPGGKPAEEPARLEALYDIEEVQDIVKYFLPGDQRL